VLISTLVQGHFPKYSDVIPKETNRKAVINSQDFSHRIRQAALLTNEESRGVRLSFTAERLTLTSRSPETGEAEATMPVKFTGEALEIAFNPAFLIDALKVITGDDVTMEFNAGNKPALMKAGPDFQYVVMPVDLA
jgi:DNA polymerase III subunit beta